MIHHNHITSTFPATKPIPKASVKRMTPVGKKTAKKQHTKRSRRFQTQSIEPVKPYVLDSCPNCAVLGCDSSCLEKE